MSTTKELSCEQYKQLLLVFEPLLKTRLTPSTMLFALGSLLGQAEIMDVHNIQKNRGNSDAVSALLRKLFNCSESNPGWFRTFMECVRETDPHLADYIEGIGNLDNLDDLDNFKQLVMVHSRDLQDINPMEILPELLSLSDIDRENIEAEQRNYGARQASMLLCCRLVQKGGRWFQEFIEALDAVKRGDLSLSKDQDGGENKDLESEYVSDVPPQEGDTHNISEADDDITEKYDDEDTEKTEATKQTDHDRFKNEEPSDVMTIKPKKYQYELVPLVLEGGTAYEPPTYYQC